MGRRFRSIGVGVGALFVLWRAVGLLLALAPTKGFEARLDEDLGIVLELAGSYCTPGGERDDLVQDIFLSSGAPVRATIRSRRLRRSVRRRMWRTAPGTVGRGT